MKIQKSKSESGINLIKIKVSFIHYEDWQCWALAFLCIIMYVYYNYVECLHVATSCCASGSWTEC